MKKILIIIIVILSFIFIGAGVFLTLKGDTSSPSDIKEEKVFQQNDDSLINDNVMRFSTLEEVKSYVYNIYDPSIVSMSTTDNIVYTFTITDGDIVVNYIYDSSTGILDVR